MFISDFRFAFRSIASLAAMSRRLLLMLGACVALTGPSAADASGSSGEVVAFAEPPAGLAACDGVSSLAVGGVDAKLARGFNLPNWDPDYSGYKPDDSLLKQLNMLGFTHIRLPVNGERFMARFASGTKRQPT